VNVVLTGRVLLLGDKLIVRTELVDAVEGWQLWGEQYNRFSSDILELQEVIAQDISGKLQVRLTGEGRLLPQHAAQ
jgi:TolB-like protein